MSILDFKSNLVGGGARPNQFIVELNFPNFVSNSANAARKAQFLCISASLPGSFVGIAPVFYRGREVKLAGERVFQNWVISAINDTDFAIHSAFVEWSNAINDVRENTGITNPLGYTSDMTVTQLSRNGERLKSYRMADAWPVAVSDIQLNFGMNDQVEEFTVELAYSFWETSSIGSTFSSNIGGINI